MIINGLEIPDTQVELESILIHDPIAYFFELLDTQFGDDQIVKSFIDNQIDRPMGTWARGPRG